MNVLKKLFVLFNTVDNHLCQRHIYPKNVVMLTSLCVASTSWNGFNLHQGGHLPTSAYISSVCMSAFSFFY